MADALLGKATMVMPDGQDLKDVAVPVHAEELCVTSVGRLLVCSTTLL